jgi:hypothetical protein
LQAIDESLLTDELKNQIQQLKNDIASLNSKIEGNTREIAVQEYYAQHIVDHLSKTIALTEEEVRLEMLNAKLAGFEAIHDEDTLKNLKARLAIEKELLQITNNRIDQAYEELSKTTGLTTDSLKSIIQNYGGEAIINTDIYKQFSDNSELQKKLTD